MDIVKSFKKGVENVKTAEISGAIPKLKAVDFAAKFKERQIDVGSDFEL